MYNTPAQPRRFAVLDIETRGSSRPEEVRREAMASASINLRLKDETIGRKLREHLDRCNERKALLDSADPVVVGVASDIDTILFHALGAAHTPQLNNAAVAAFDNVPTMLISLRSWLESNLDGESIIVGHNVKFDLAKLRHSYVRAGVRLPAPLAAPDQPICDTMRLYCSRLSISDAPMIALADALESLGLEHHKGIADGSQVEVLLDQGQIDALLMYNLLDVMAERNLFLRLTGEPLPSLR